MNRNVSQTAHILGEDVPQVKKWASLFKEYLSSQANPPKGQTRQFSDCDLLVLSYVCAHWEADPDLEAIKIGLNQENHHDERFVEHLYFHTPFFQEPPDGLDETWSHGAMLGGMLNVDLELQGWMIADAYRLAGDALVDSIVKNRTHEAYEVIWPVLFL